MTDDHNFAEARRLMNEARDLSEDERALLAEQDRIQSAYFTECDFEKTIRQARGWGLSDDEIRSIFEGILAHGQAQNFNG
jgi:hypothetical protein